MRPRSEYKHVELTPERENRIMEHLQPMLDAIERQRKPKA
jgi:hypothetical protein